MRLRLELPQRARGRSTDRRRLVVRFLTRVSMHPCSPAAALVTRVAGVERGALAPRVMDKRDGGVVHLLPRLLVCVLHGPLVLGGAAADAGGPVGEGSRETPRRNRWRRGSGWCQASARLRVHPNSALHGFDPVTEGGRAETPRRFMWRRARGWGCETHHCGCQAGITPLRTSEPSQQENGRRRYPGVT